MRRKTMGRTFKGKLPKAKEGFPWDIDKCKGRPAEELDYFDCPFSTEVRLEDFSKEFLIKLMTIWQEWYMTMNMVWHAHMQENLGTEKAGRIMIDVWLKTTEAKMDKYIPLLGKDYKTRDDMKTIEDGVKIGILPPDGTLQSTVWDGTLEWEDDEHARAVVHHCVMLETFEAMDNLEPLKILCNIQEPVCSEAYFINPRMKMLPIKLPPRKSKDEPCCIWEFKMMDEEVKRPGWNC
jgi:hypothetical protein